MRKTGNYAALHGVDGIRKDNGNSGRCPLDGQGCGSRDHDDNVDVQANHFRCEFIEARSLVPSIAALNDEVLALNISKCLQTLEQCVIETLVPACEKPHPPDFVRILAERCKG